MKKINLAIVGCGWAGEIHADDLALIAARFTVLACCDPDADRRNAFASKYGIARAVATLDEILRMEDVDAVAICTPPALHAKMVLATLAADKHAICEKPFVESLAAIDAIEAAERQSKGRVMPIFQYRYGDGAAKVQHVIRSGLAGKHYVTAVEVARTRAAEYYSVQWRGKFATELGGVLVTQAIHINDMLSWLLGPIATVSSFKTTRVNPIEVEDCAVTALRMRDGSLVSIACTLGSVGQFTRMRLCFENVTFERNSDHDKSKPADDPWTVQARTPELARTIEQTMAQAPTGHGWFARQYELFGEALNTGAPFPVTLDDARTSIELVTAQYYSDKTGQSVSLPLAADHPGYGGWLPGW